MLRESLMSSAWLLNEMQRPLSFSKLFIVPISETTRPHYDTVHLNVSNYCSNVT